MKSHLPIAIVLTFLTLGGFAEERELLAKHETVAVVENIKYQLCRGLTSLCPDRCGQSGEVATFKILRYINFESHSQYGEKQDAFYVQLTDYDRKPLTDIPFADTTKKLKKGDHVYLSWNHDYVTKGGASSPERPVTKLEIIPKDEVTAALSDETPSTLKKIEFDISKIDENGLRGPVDGKVSVSYEFKIPNRPGCIAEVARIDPSAGFSAGSQGRIGAGDNEVLVIGETNQADYKKILLQLSELDYVEKIIECFFE